MRSLNVAILGIPIPEKMKRLPISNQGFPTPWFVGKVDGEYDFRVADPAKLYAAIKRNLCWLCGQPLGVHKVFVIGPMCAVNRISAEAPCHFECADYSVRACPFLSKPRMRRNEVDMPEGATMSESGIKRNPGVAVIWVTKSFKLIRDGDSVLFKIGEPERVLWFVQGRTATRSEIDESIRTGLPLLEELAGAEGPKALEALAAQVKVAEALLPAA
jgi:hypothetical protein